MCYKDCNKILLKIKGCDSNKVNADRPDIVGQYIPKKDIKQFIDNWNSFGHIINLFHKNWLVYTTVGTMYRSVLLKDILLTKATQ